MRLCPEKVRKPPPLIKNLIKKVNPNQNKGFFESERWLETGRGL